ncbi:hypothetical protein [Phenylobacterium sp.]|uniref:hypothetical protein n=1 Tax=Phenylobacterium sp. TaxID=1871053 RepID=UPI002EDA229D
MVAVVATAAVGVGAMMWPVLSRPPGASYPPPASRTEANLQDLHYLERFARVNRSFSPAERAAFLAQVLALQRRAGELDAASLEMGIARAVAVAGDAHTNVRGAAWGLSLNAIPLRFAWFREGLFVVMATRLTRNWLARGW